MVCHSYPHCKVDTDFVWTTIDAAIARMLDENYLYISYDTVGTSIKITRNDDGLVFNATLNGVAVNIIQQPRRLHCEYTLVSDDKSTCVKFQSNGICMDRAHVETSTMGEYKGKIVKLILRSVFNMKNGIIIMQSAECGDTDFYDDIHRVDDEITRGLLRKISPTPKFVMSILDTGYKFPSIAKYGSCIDEYDIFSCGCEHKHAYAKHVTAQRYCKTCKHQLCFLCTMKSCDELFNRKFLIYETHIDVPNVLAPWM